MQQVTRIDPAPSRLRYRMQRMMLTPAYRLMLRVGLPLALTFGGAAFWLSQPETIERITLAWSDARAMIEERPEFMVKLMAVDGASDEVAEEVRARLAVDFPVSSFDLDLEAMRDTVAELAAVKSVRLHIRQGGVLEVDVEERVPAVLWRTAQGLWLVDPEGVVVGPAETRSAHPDLPVMVGDGADLAVAELSALHVAAAPLRGRLRGFVRKGARRWDVVLDRGQRIMLPEAGAVRALERAIAMDDAVDLLARDLVAVDLRLPRRPTLRMTDHALEELWRIKAIEAGTQNR
ncbi:Cell division protein FtsQ [Roseivivax jejudonensis]|uniref:Cell division protein FtsQ n=1 Tax=Roseivivax jejudonensis TaxID=1529041 RepID=A0A1X6ZH77_9RHOB|nr:cell division protein FtsQ/DivIB [Roseivivax jejudonensis]SLN50819.1 Cell division protein FtsQ [Roseivivax jejudonensis]